MTNRDDLELRLATALAPMLLTIAIFSLTLVGNIAHPDSTHVDEVLCLLCAFCILGAATVADSALDKVGLSVRDRLFFLGGGYLFFCLAVGVVSIVIPLLYVAKAFPAADVHTWQYILYICTGTSVTVKLMQNKEKAWTVGMVILFVLTMCVTSAERYLIH
ncbi:MAG: hypothetical protein KGI42_05660 [Xanthomonadaceae bacterium]|nr:hypothetical protein [Xanthomonadaceae bacterium]